MMQKEMKKNMMLGVMTAMAFLMIFLLPMSVSAKQASVKQDVVISRMKGNTISYHKAVFVHEIMPNADWENIVGYGKKAKIKFTKKTKFYLLDAETMKTYKTSKATFLKEVYPTDQCKEDGVTFYEGMACKLTIKNGKCVKVVQIFQE